MEKLVATRISGGNSAYGRSKSDFYPTPPDVTQALLDFLHLPKDTIIWEPACGEGHMVSVLEKNGMRVKKSDIQTGEDFLEGNMKPIYKPKGKAKEYGDYAINIYTGCPHRCYYCFAPSVLRRNREKFHSHVEPRENIVEEVRKQLERENITGKTIHLCFTCDPYPTGYDTTPTREIIKLLKKHGNHVQILTKGDGSRDFDLLDGDDWYGVTYSGADEQNEPGALKCGYRLFSLAEAKTKGIKTWCSFEPVANAENVLWTIEEHKNIFDKIKIGKLNYWPSEIDWNKFGHDAEKLCRQLKLEYYIKESLRKEIF